MNVALVLLTYQLDAPAGIERSIGALAVGLRQLGHRPVILTAASNRQTPRDVPVIRLRSVRLPYPAVEDDLLSALADPAPVVAEVRAVLDRHRIGLACWADTSWGLGWLAPAPPGVRTALMVRVPRRDRLFDLALARRPHAVLTNSRFVCQQAAAAGYDTSAWRPVPNAVISTAEPPGPGEREALRRHGPVRLAARAEPQKGICQLIDAAPARLGRPLQVALAAAGFEYWPGMQQAVIDGCRLAAARAPTRVQILPGMPWADVPAFFADAAVTVISSIEPETFCNAAAEALSVGTPVVGYHLGYLPELVGPAGLTVPLAAGARGLWTAAAGLLADASAYQRAARAAPTRLLAHRPAAAARAFLVAVEARPAHSVLR